MKFVNDEIGDEYLSWDTPYILISSQTGSGKTTFVLERLLDNAIKHDKYVLYICNRKLLGMQVDCDSEGALIRLFPELEAKQILQKKMDHLIIHTYQYFEQAGLSLDGVYTVPDLSQYGEHYLRWLKSNGMTISGKLIPMDDIMYYVYDEAHYFLADSIFNSDCNYWFDRFSHPPIGFPNNAKGTHVFLTATPEPLKLFLAAHMLNQSEGITAECRKIVEAYNQKYELLQNAKRLIRNEHHNLSKIHGDNKNFVPSFSHGWNDSSKQKSINFAESQDEPEVTITYAHNDDKEELRDKAWLIKPEAELMKLLKQKFDRLPIKEYKLNNDFIFKDMPTLYFSKYETLYNEIKAYYSNKNNTGKWLVFVDAKKDGQWLETKLKDSGIASVFVFHKCMQENEAAEEVGNVCERKKFRCQVLISTAVMDCGVTIKDENVKYIAISETDRTTFLQMLGRKRLGDKEKITLYIRKHNIKRINSMVWANHNKLKALAEYEIRNDSCVVQSGCGNEDSNDHYATGYSVKREKSSANLEKLFAQFDLPEYSQMLYRPKGKYLDSDMPTSEIESRREAGKSTLIELIYHISQDTQAKENARDKDVLGGVFEALDRVKRDRDYYFEYQLSWIGQKYDCKKDLDYLHRVELRKKEIQYLEEMSDSIILKKGQVAERPDTIWWECFSRMCCEILEMPIEPNAKAYGCCALTNMFRKWQIPYSIKSKTVSISNNKCTIWKIVYTDRF